eukprot:Skav218084  [mRNA]  locus=scaffold3382:85836:87559:- [translate_table: standard]
MTGRSGRNGARHCTKNVSNISESLLSNSLSCAGTRCESVTAPLSEGLRRPLEMPNPATLRGVCDWTRSMYDPSVRLRSLFLVEAKDQGQELSRMSKSFAVFGVLKAQGKNYGAYLRTAFDNTKWMQLRLCFEFPQRQSNIGRSEHRRL